jgi:hypothetical protein
MIAILATSQNWPQKLKNTASNVILVAAFDVSRYCACLAGFGIGRHCGIPGHCCCSRRREALEIAINRFGPAPDHVAAIIVPRIRWCSSCSSSISRTKNQTYWKLHCVWLLHWFPRLSGDRISFLCCQWPIERARARTHTHSLSKDRRGITMMRRALCFPLQSSLQVRRRKLFSMNLRCGLDSAEWKED